MRYVALKSEIMKRRVSRLVWLGEKCATIELLLGYSLVYDQLGGCDVNKKVPTFSVLSIWPKKCYSFRMHLL